MAEAGRLWEAGDLEAVVAILAEAEGLAGLVVEVLEAAEPAEAGRSRD